MRILSKEAANECKARLNSIAKPAGSLGAFEDMIIQIAAVTGTPDIDISRKALVVYCADNGVCARGVSLYDYKMTSAVVKLLKRGSSCVSAMAKACGVNVFAYDIGMRDLVDGITDKKLIKGTNDMTNGPAMSRECAVKAVCIGIETVRELKSKGYNIIAAGEVGMGNTTAASAVTSVLLDLAPCVVTGRGAGADDVTLTRKIAAIEQAIEFNKPNPNDTIDVLHKVGGLDIAALAGLFIGGAVYNLPIVTDGFITGAAALIAMRLRHSVRDFLIPSHESAEPGARYINEALNLKPVIKADMRAGEGTGAVMMFTLLDMALSVYKNAARYGDMNE